MEVIVFSGTFLLLACWLSIRADRLIRTRKLRRAFRMDSRRRRYLRQRSKRLNKEFRSLYRNLNLSVTPQLYLTSGPLSQHASLGVTGQSTQVMGTTVDYKYHYPPGKHTVDVNSLSIHTSQVYQNKLQLQYASHRLATALTDLKDLEPGQIALEALLEEEYGSPWS